MDDNIATTTPVLIDPTRPATRDTTKKFFKDFISHDDFRAVDIIRIPSITRYIICIPLTNWYVTFADEEPAEL